MVDYLCRYDLESTCYGGSWLYRYGLSFCGAVSKPRLQHMPEPYIIAMLDLYALIIAGRPPDSESLTCCNVVVASQLGNEPRTCPARVDIRIP